MIVAVLKLLRIFRGTASGNIVALDMAKLGEEVICRKNAFLCAAVGTRVDITFYRRLGARLFGGEGLVLQSLKGDGMAFIQVGGTVVERQLDGEILRVDTGCLVGFAHGIDYDIERTGGVKSMIFDGAGMFLATLSGHGTVWLQSLPFARMVDRILVNGSQE